MAARKRAKINIPMAAACVLLCLTLFSVHFTGDIYAKYVSRAAGEDGARVATFGNLTLIESGDFANAAKTATIIPGHPLTKNATVSFTGSEVAVYVIFETEVSGGTWNTSADNKTFTFEKNGKNSLKWSVADGWTYIEGSKTGNRYAYYKTLDPNDTLMDCPLIAGDGKITVSDKITRFEISDYTEIGIDLRAYVIQAGNLNPLEAWEKVKQD